MGTNRPARSGRVPRMEGELRSLSLVICPKCQNVMTTVDKNGIHIEQCGGCRGIFWTGANSNRSCARRTPTTVPRLRRPTVDHPTAAATAASRAARRARTHPALRPAPLLRGLAEALPGRRLLRRFAQALPGWLLRGLAEAVRRVPTQAQFPGESVRLTSDVLDLKICPACGDRAQRPAVEEERLVCAACGHRAAFHRLPLFALTGPSGAWQVHGGAQLARRLSGEVVVLEQDVLWTGGLRDDVDGHPRFRSTWLRMAAMIHQSGRPVVLCGTVVPPEFEPLPERVFFADIHYLALVAEPEVLTRRLRARPAWRGGTNRGSRRCWSSPSGCGGKRRGCPLPWSCSTRPRRR